MLNRIIIVLGASLLALPIAHANPMSLEVLRLRQLPGSEHVQVTYAVDNRGGPAAVAPTAITRDGKALSGAWKLASFTANTGSGLASTSAQQFCDCDVTPGSHNYVITVKTSYGTSMTGTVSVVKGGQGKDAGLPKADAGAQRDLKPASDLAPWEIPEPTAVQGWDCRTTCGSSVGQEGAIPKSDAATMVDGGVAADRGVAVNPEKDDDGGCSLSGTGTGSLPLLLLALLALARRRSR